MGIPRRQPVPYSAGRGVEAPAAGTLPSKEMEAAETSILLVPVARDGTAFIPELGNSRAYTIGPKGEERKVADYRQALQELRAMPKACWRRPNDAGNWGIVTAVRWEMRSIAAA